jgi:hypothetical protein
MMPDLKRGLLATLAELMELAPDVRLGQLMSWLGFLGEDQVDRGLGDIEDDELLAVMYRHRAELTARLQGVEPFPPAPSAVPLSVSGSPMDAPTTPTAELGR